jgi:hypothetical protein
LSNGEPLRLLGFNLAPMRVSKVALWALRHRIAPGGSRTRSSPRRLRAVSTAVARAASCWYRRQPPAGVGGGGSPSLWARGAAEGQQDAPWIPGEGAARVFWEVVRGPLARGTVDTYVGTGVHCVRFGSALLRRGDRQRPRRRAGGPPRHPSAAATVHTPEAGPGRGCAAGEGCAAVSSHDGSRQVPCEGVCGCGQVAARGSDDLSDEQGREYWRQA